jgi:hypothetical protein
MIVSAAQGEVLFHPDDLGPELEARRVKSLGDLAGMKPRMPHIDHVSRKETIRLGPVETVVMVD